MFKAIRHSSIVAMATGVLFLGACAADGNTARISQSATGMHEVSALYGRVTMHQRRAVRKPVREARSRALRLLGAKAEQLLAETGPWDSDARLTSVAVADRDGVRASVKSFRASLTGLAVAARSARMAEVRRQYSSAMNSYGKLSAVTSTTD